MADGITRIGVGGFKSIRTEQAIEIRPLTILAGANSSGKSSIMQPLLLVKQTLEAPYDPGPLMLDGPNVYFTSTEQMFSKLGRRGPCSAFSVTLEENRQTFTKLTYKRAGESVDIESMEVGSKASPKRFWPEMSREDFTNALPEAKDLPIYLVRNRCFLAVEMGGSPRTTIYPSAIISEHIRSVIHVPGLRGNPERTYKTTAVGDNLPGTFEPYVASVILDWQTSENLAALDLMTKSLRKLGLTGKVEARQLDATRISVEVGRLPEEPKGGSQDLVNIADVGFGVSQALPVVVALIVANTGNLVYLEQPELHLHPRAQLHMAEVLAEAARRGIRVVAETHSSVLLRGVQTLVARGELSPKLVKLHWFTRNKSGYTDIQSADLDEEGAYGEWPEDFDEVNLAVEREYLDAGEARQARR